MRRAALVRPDVSIRKRTEGCQSVRSARFSFPSERESLARALAVDAERTLSYPTMGMEPRPSGPPPVENVSPLGLKMMIEVFEALARSRVPAGYRVVYRTNPRGEHVVAVIWPPETP